MTTSVLERFSSGVTSARRKVQVAFAENRQLLRTHRRELRLIRAAYWGLVSVGMGLAIAYPSFHTQAWKSTEADLDRYSFGRVVTKAYADGHYTTAAAATFFVNLFVGSALTITAPSFVLPFSGLAMTAVRATLWGTLFPPNAKDSTVPHYITMIIEGEAYVMAALAGWVQSRDVLRQLLSSRQHQSQKGPNDTPKRSIRWPSLQEGLRVTLAAYPLITVTLGVAALWEAYECIYLPPPGK